jgi:hypothetical protein
MKIRFRLPDGPLTTQKPIPELRSTLETKYEEGEDDSEGTPERVFVLDTGDNDNTFGDIRKAMGKEIFEDEDLLIGYVANVAMCLHDQFNRADFKDQGTRNEAARSILHLIFRS